jgi:hypothetical protein
MASPLDKVAIRPIIGEPQMMWPAGPILSGIDARWPRPKVM